MEQGLSLKLIICRAFRNQSANDFHQAKGLSMWVRVASHTFHLHISNLVTHWGRCLRSEKRQSTRMKGVSSELRSRLIISSGLDLHSHVPLPKMELATYCRRLTHQLFLRWIYQNLESDSHSSLVSQSRIRSGFMKSRCKLWDSEFQRHEFRVKWRWGRRQQARRDYWRSRAKSTSLRRSWWEKRKSASVWKST